MSTAFEQKYWPCGCREEHRVGTCVHAASSVAGDKGPPGEYLPPVAYRLLKALGIFGAGVSGSRYMNGNHLPIFRDS